MNTIAVIGSGITGLACAQRLAQAGLRPVLFDKGRGIGGRCATRRLEGLQFDHGAQYVTARSDGFAAVLQKLKSADAVALWPDETGRRRLVGVPGMSALSKALGHGLDVRQGAQVACVVQAGSDWLVNIDGAALPFTHVVMTVPAPQVEGLLGKAHPLVARIADVRMAPCLTLMASVRGPAPFINRADADDPLAWIAQDSSKSGRPQGEAIAWVAQAGERFSFAHLDEEPTAIAARMVPLLCERLGASMEQVTHAAVHRWRYARVTAPLGQPFLRSDEGTLHLGGDWCLGERIEDAWTSGVAIADDILSSRP